MAGIDISQDLYVDPSRYTFSTETTSGLQTASSVFYGDSISFGESTPWLGDLYEGLMDFPMLFMPTTAPTTLPDGLDPAALMNLLSDLRESYANNIDSRTTPPADAASSTLTDVFYNVFADALSQYVNGERLVSGEWQQTSTPLSAEQAQLLVNYRMTGQMPASEEGENLKAIATEINAYIKLEFEGELDLPSLEAQVNNLSQLGAGILDDLQTQIDSMPEGPEKEALKAFLGAASATRRKLQTALSALGRAGTPKGLQKQLAKIKALLSQLKSDFTDALDDVSDDPFLGHVLTSQFAAFEGTVSTFLREIDSANIILDLKSGDWSNVLNGVQENYVQTLANDFNTTFDESLAELDPKLAAKLRFVYYFPKYANTLTQNQQALFAQLEVNAKTAVATDRGIPVGSIPGIGETNQANFEAQIISSAYHTVSDTLDDYDASSLVGKSGLEGMSEDDIKGLIEYYYFHPADTSSPREVLNSAINSIEKKVQNSVRKEFGITAKSFPVETGAFLYNQNLGTEFMYQFHVNLQESNFTPRELAAIKGALANPLSPPVSDDTKALLQGLIDKTTADIRNQNNLPQGWVPPGMLLTEYGNLSPRTVNEWNKLSATEATSKAIRDHVTTHTSGSERRSYISYLTIIAKALVDVKMTLALMATSDSFIVGNLSDMRVSLAKAMDLERKNMQQKLKARQAELDKQTEREEGKARTLQIVKEVALVVAVVVVTTIACVALAPVLGPVGIALAIGLASTFLVTKITIQEQAAAGDPQAQNTISWLKGQPPGSYKVGDSAPLMMGAVTGLMSEWETALQNWGVSEEWVSTVQLGMFVGTMLAMNVVGLFLLPLLPITMAAGIGGWMLVGTDLTAKAAGDQATRITGNETIGTIVKGLVTIYLIVLEIIAGIVFTVLTGGAGIEVLIAKVAQEMSKILAQAAKWVATTARQILKYMDDAADIIDAAVDAAKSGRSLILDPSVNKSLGKLARALKNAPRIVQVLAKIAAKTWKGSRYLLKQINEFLDQVNDFIKGIFKTMDEKILTRSSKRLKKAEKALKKAQKTQKKADEALDAAQTAATTQTRAQLAQAKKAVKEADDLVDEAQNTFTKARDYVDESIDKSWGKFFKDSRVQQGKARKTRMEEAMGLSDELAEARKLVDKTQQAAVKTQKELDDARRLGTADTAKLGALQEEAAKATKKADDAAKALRVTQEASETTIQRANFMDRLAYKLEKHAEDYGKIATDMTAAKKKLVHGKGIKQRWGGAKDYYKSLTDLSEKTGALTKLESAITSASTISSTVEQIIAYLNQARIYRVRAEMAEIEAKFEPIILVLRESVKMFEKMLDQMLAGAEGHMSQLASVSAQQNKLWRDLSASASQMADAN